MKTREAYNVIVKRIEAKTRALNIHFCFSFVASVMGLIIYGIFVTLFVGGLQNENKEMIVIPFIVIAVFAPIFALVKCSRMRARMKEDEEVKEIAILRRNATGPSSALQLPDWLQERQNKRSGGTTFNDSSAYYGGAAACGVSPYSYTGGGATGSGGGEEW